MMNPRATLCCSVAIAYATSSLLRALQCLLTVVGAPPTLDPPDGDSLHVQHALQPRSGYQWTYSCPQARSQPRVRIPYDRVGSRSLDGLAAQPLAVDRPSYTRSKQILRRYLDNSDSDSGGTIAGEEAEDSSVDKGPAGSHKVHEGIVSVAISGPPTAGEIKTAHSGNAISEARGTVHEAVVLEAMTNGEPPGCSPGVSIAVATTIEASPDNSINVLEQTFVSVVRVLTTESTDRGDDNSYEHVAAEFELEDYAKELAFLLDLTEPAETKLDYTANNVQNPELSAEQQASLIAVLKNPDKNNDR
ncbi:unnamed protein product [Phytophthora fragariaefolia]|uniref:Unnamed protein product n=1 Tax=Phytophthora fragariaefolia TaxID=1490495 RepID=A0A9W7D3J5_9STRA|nr:unnamed protein product [Phytophthora fragariaefolia]